MSRGLSQRTLYRSAYLFVSVAVLFLDQWTKGIVTRDFAPHESREVMGRFFILTYVRNSGAAFGLFANFESAIKSILLNSVAVAAFIAVSVYAYRSHFKSIRLQMGLALVLGGAVGNLVDRVRFGYVVDFLLFGVGGHYWPAFNVADSAICVGVGLLALDMLRQKAPLSVPPAAP
ncbi:MAG: signal peptidase II [Thermoanaerobaculia bacterium]